MEIGSVLELDQWGLYSIPEQNKQFWLPFMKNKSYRTNFYQSGRNAIESLLLFLKGTKSVQKLLLPDYMCETVKDAGKRAGITLEYYKVDGNYDFAPEEIEPMIKGEAALFVAHFFGKKLRKDLLDWVMTKKEQGIIVIEDVTLSLFSADEEEGVGFGTYTLGSIRKWLPVPDGGFVASCSEELPKEVKSNTVSKYTDYYLMVQTMKKEYIDGDCQNKDLKKIYMDYYGLSIKELFSDYEIYPMSKWTENYLQNYDLEAVVAKRMENYDYLYAKISKLDGLSIKMKREEGYLPFGMVLQTKNRDELIQYLIQNDIYCNVHWRLEPSEDNEDLTMLAKESITIPCDQRYGLKEMDYIVEALERWVGK